MQKSDKLEMLTVEGSSISAFYIQARAKCEKPYAEVFHILHGLNKVLQDKRIGEKNYGR